MGFLEMLFLVLLVLKLVGLITISWIWVFAPLIPALILWTLALILMLLAAILDLKD